MPNQIIRMAITGTNECTIYATCRMCKTDLSADCNDAESFLKWCNGQGLAQDMMPGLTIAFRELLISGTCGECFDKLFKEE